MKQIENYLSGILFWGVLFLFAFIPLYPKFPLFGVSGTFVAIRLEDLFISATLVIWVLYLGLSEKYKEILHSRLIHLFLLFFFTGFVSTVSAIFLTNTVEFHISILHYLRRIEFMLLLPVVVTVIQTKKQLMVALVTLVVVISFVNIYALGQQYLDWPVISTTNSEFSKGLILRLSPGARVNSTFAGHYDLAAFLAMVIAVMTAIFFAVGKRIKIAVLILTGVSMFVLIMTAARVSFVAAFAGIILSLIFSNKKKYLFLIFIAIAVVLIYPSQLRDRFISTITVNILNLGQRYEGQTSDQKIRSRLNIPTLAIKTSSQSGETSIFASQSGGVATDITPGEPLDTTQLGVFRSFQIRFQIEWPRALNAFSKNPFLGTGYSSLGIATDNDFLRSLGEVGILGTVAFGLIFVDLIKKIAGGLKNENKLTGYFCAGTLSLIGALLINGLFIDVFEASKVATFFWMIMGLSLASLKLK